MQQLFTVIIPLYLCILKFICIFPKRENIVVTVIKHLKLASPNRKYQLTVEMALCLTSLMTVNIHNGIDLYYEQKSK